MNKASGGDGISAELFQILKDNVVKVLYSVCQQIWRTQQRSQDWERSVFIPISTKGNAKNVQTTAQNKTHLEGTNWNKHNLENSAVGTGLEKVSFHPNPKERQCQRMFKLPHNCTHFTC